MRRISLKSTLTAAIIFMSPANASESAAAEISLPIAIEEHFETLRGIKTSNVTTENAGEIIKSSNEIITAAYENLAIKYIVVKQLQNLCLDKLQSFIFQNTPPVHMAFTFWTKVINKCKGILKIEAVGDFADGKPAPVDWSKINGDSG